MQEHTQVPFSNRWAQNVIYRFFFHICSTTAFLMFASIDQLLMFKILVFSWTQENIGPVLLPLAGKFGSHWHNHTPVHQRCSSVCLHKWCTQQDRGNWCSWRRLSYKHCKENQQSASPHNGSHLLDIFKKMLSCVLYFESYRNSWME